MFDSFWLFSLVGWAQWPVSMSCRVTGALRRASRAAQLTTAWVDAYTKAHHITTLDDFVFMITAAEWEKSLEAHIEQVAELKGNRIAVARFKKCVPCWAGSTEAGRYGQHQD